MAGNQACSCFRRWCHNILWMTIGYITILRGQESKTEDRIQNSGGTPNPKAQTEYPKGPNRISKPIDDRWRERIAHCQPIPWSWRASAPSAPWNDVSLRPATAPRGPQTFRSLQPMRLSYRLVCRVARWVSAISFMLPNRKSYFGILPGGCVAPKPVWAWRR
jgi:hypothetical protein